MKSETLKAAWGSLPPQLRALYVVAGEGEAAWLADALRADNASRVLLDEAAGSGVGLAALRERIYDVVLLGHAPPQLDAIEFTAGLRAGGSEEPVIILGRECEADLSAFCYEVGADAYLCLESVTTRSFLWTLARAVERHQLIAENRRLAQAERNRQQQEQGEAERLLAGQRALVDQCRHSAAAGPQTGPWSEALQTHYRELLRAHVIMGSGNLSSEMAALAGALSAAQVATAEVLALHVEAVEELVRGLGSRSARHIMSRADLLVLELLAELAECHRSGRGQTSRLHERLAPATVTLRTSA